MPESEHAAELVRLGFEKLDKKDGITYEDIAVFPDSDLPCFFLVDSPTMEVTFAVDEFRTVWEADGLIDLSYLGFSEMEMNDPEGVEEAEYTVH